MQIRRKQKQPWTKAEKWLLASVFGILAVAAFIVVGSRYLRPVPDLVVPTPTMPTPNAFDFYLSAANKFRGSHSHQYFYALWKQSYGNAPRCPADILTQSTSLIQDNQDALKTLRQGFPYAYQSPPMRSINDKAPYWATERDLARLLVLEGQVKAAHGDWNGDVQCDLDAIQMGQQIPHGAVITGALVGIACQSIGRHFLWAATNHLTAAQAKVATWRLEKIQASHLPLAQTLQEEEWFGQAAMLDVFHRGVFGPIPNLMQSIYLRRYTRYMDQSITNARLPYAAKPPDPDPPQDIVNTLFLPLFDNIGIKDTDTAAQNALLLTTFALRAYQVDHHAYPATLAALVPEYLPSVPDDPFALTGLLRYKRIGNGYSLYSVGPDGMDDGGKPIFDNTKPVPQPGKYDLRYYAAPDSRGDIVAGVNI